MQQPKTTIEISRVQKREGNHCKSIHASEISIKFGLGLPSPHSPRWLSVCVSDPFDKNLHVYVPVAAAMAAQQNALPLCSEYAAIAQSAAETGQEPQVINPKIPEDSREIFQTYFKHHSIETEKNRVVP